MSTQPLLTIGLPVYNGERYLREALDSILGQTFADFILLVSDNASTDATRDICEEYAKRDNRVRYLRHVRNLGAADNYNGVFRASHSLYFKWATHDDTYAPTFLERCLEVLEAEPETVLCFAPAVFIDETGREIARENPEPDYTDVRASRRFRAWVFEKREGWCHPIMGVIRSEVLAQTPLVGKYASSDRILIAELALHGPMRRLDDHLYHRRDHPERSVVKSRRTSDLTSWYDTAARSNKTYMPRWRWGTEYSRAITRVPMSPAERAACAKLVARWFVTRRGVLAGELVGRLRRRGARVV